MPGTLKNFESIISGHTPVIVDFYAEWCLPCRMLGPILENLAADMGDRIRILKVDVDKNPDLAERYSIYSVPTILLFQDGQVMWKGSGARPGEELKRIIFSETSIADSA